VPDARRLRHDPPRGWGTTHVPVPSVLRCPDRLYGAMHSGPIPVRPLRQPISKAIEPRCLRRTLRRSAAGSPAITELAMSCGQSVQMTHTVMSGSPMSAVQAAWSSELGPPSSEAAALARLR
jgi:hypothetical protein